MMPPHEMTMQQPTVKPQNPHFSSGPCSKRPGYNVAALQLDTLGRSHRSAIGKRALGLACSETARILGLPAGYRVAVVPAWIVAVPSAPIVVTTPSTPTTLVVVVAI